ncbi:hypothetical protein [Pedobacter sp. NJ-S-72]
MKKYIFYALSIFLFSGVNMAAFGQTKIDCNQVLDQEPYFAKHQALSTDSLFLRDVEVLKHCGGYGDIDSLMLKRSVLWTILHTAMDEGKPATYRTMINFMQEFKSTPHYRLFVASLHLYKNLGNTKVNPAEFDLAQPFFVQIGFTKNDIDDFKEFISNPVHHNLTYIAAAYELYMKEFELATGGSK